MDMTQASARAPQKVQRRVARLTQMPSLGCGSRLALCLLGGLRTGVRRVNRP